MHYVSGSVCGFTWFRDDVMGVLGRSPFAVIMTGRVLRGHMAAATICRHQDENDSEAKCLKARLAVPAMSGHMLHNR